MHWLEQTFKHSSLRRAATGTHIGQVTGAKHLPSTCRSIAPTCYFAALAVTYLLLEHLGRERSRGENGCYLRDLSGVTTLVYVLARSIRRAAAEEVPRDAQVFWLRCSSC